jgi:hypothetical protein
MTGPYSESDDLGLFSGLFLSGFQTKILDTELNLL